MAGLGKRRTANRQMYVRFLVHPSSGAHHRYAHLARDSVKTAGERVAVTVSEDANVTQGAFATP